MKGQRIERSDIVDVLRRAPKAVIPLDTLVARLVHGRHRSRGVRKALLAQLRRLVREGEVERVVGGYRLARADGLIEGEVRSVDRLGEAVVIDNRDTPWTVATYDDVEPGTRVLVAPTDTAASRGSLVDRLDPAADHWVGIVHTDRREPCVAPYRSKRRFRVAITRRDLQGARDGEVVLVAPVEERRRRRGERESSRGKVVERLGVPGDPEADFRAIAFNHHLRVAFPAAALDEVEDTTDRIDPRELALRRDLRALPFLTIDPATARDHDDAVFIEVPTGKSEPSNQASDAQASNQAPDLQGPLTLWVAIADVSHYVPPESALDREALRRGNSVYFCDRAIPMLPERLSGDLCSLRAGVDRLSVAVSMQVLPDGRVRSSRVHLAVVRVRENLSYEQVVRTIESKKHEAPEHGFSPEVHEQLVRLGEVERRLGRRRFEQGSIDFDLPESEVVLDDEGQPVAIERRDRTRAHRAVEEAMLAANRAVAQWLIRGERGAIFRVHDPPANDRLEMLHDELARFDLLGRSPLKTLDSKQIHRALQRVRGRPIAPRVNMLALRTMTQARYVEDNRGHYALGFDAYLHFTSPIRRYADLVVHRVLKHALAPERYAPDRAAASNESRAQVARFISYRERVAIEAERDSLDLKKCVFMRERIGEEYTGRITGVTSRGLFVTLDEHDVTGFVLGAQLGFGLEFDEVAQSLTARGSGARYSLGDALRVRVEDVRIERGWIRFEALFEGTAPTDQGDERGPHKKRKGPKGVKKPGRVKKGRRGGQRVRRKSSPSRGRGRR
ncbi:MAG: VacB/RNase II family 3'-5' exoribonuclease [Myxococcota bacterium]|jgi:ribonuclease R|nr:VacB/RNase II family 3'-5' exoribonuclease [Myxococcota bacterium]